MNLVRHELGLSKMESRFPTKGTCLAIYSRVVNAQAELPTVLGKSFPWCVGWAAELKDLFAAYVEAKQAQKVLDYDDFLALVVANVPRARHSGPLPAASTTFWLTNIRILTACSRRS